VLYCKMLEEALRPMRGDSDESEERRPLARVLIELPLEACLPTEFLGEAKQRIALYRRLAEARKKSQVEALREEMRDRYGPLPSAVTNLLDLARLRINARRLGVSSIQYREAATVKSIELEGRQLDASLAARIEERWAPGRGSLTAR
jgi:transcription-repair coupling factor (superfamily II helicase)